MKVKIVCAAILLLLLFTSAVGQANAEPLYIKVRATKLRSQPQQWASAIADLRYGTAVQAVSKSGAWHTVQLGNKKGYVHDSALSERKVVLQSASSVSGGGDRDIILAGKGFNKEVEKGYAAENSALNYAEVDKMERLTVSDTELATFARAGQLGGGK